MLDLNSRLIKAFRCILVSRKTLKGQFQFLILCTLTISYWHFFHLYCFWPWTIKNIFFFAFWNLMVMIKRYVCLCMYNCEDIYGISDTGNLMPLTLEIYLTSNNLFPIFFLLFFYTFFSLVSVLLKFFFFFLIEIF